MQPDGSLSPPQDTIPTDGARPAFTTVLSTGQVGAANYNGANAIFVPTTGSPLSFAKNASPVAFPVNPGTLSHPHMVLEHGDEVFIPDLVSLSYFSRRTCRTKILDT